MVRRRSTGRCPVLPGMVRGAPRRNALVLVAYLFVAFVVIQALWPLS